MRRVFRCLESVESARIAVSPFVARLEAGDDLVEEMEHLAAKYEARAAWVTGLALW
jgi:predicted DNA-binding protein with PD1-like motif